jgi:uncharacterized membrane protein
MIETPPRDCANKHSMDRATQNGQAHFAPADIARDVAPLVAAAAATAAGIATLQRRKPVAARRAARFVHLLLASLLLGSAVGGERFTHPAQRALQPSQYLAAEQAITRRYLPMLALMPASVLAGLLALALMPKRQGLAFWLTIAGTLSLLGTFVTTLAELPLNRQTLTTSPDAPDTWLHNRRQWDRLNHLRTALNVVGWSSLSLAAFSEEQDERTSPLVQAIEAAERVGHWFSSWRR